MEVLDEELTQLRPQVQEQTEKRARMRQELEAAKAAELRERELLQLSRDSQRKRAHVLTLRMQSAIRGWMVRRRFVRALNKEYAAQAGYIALLPNQLRDQLRDLRQSVHELRYKGEHKDQAIIFLQAVWRGVLARRAVRILRIAESMRRVLRRMNDAATRIAAWFRAIHMRLKYRDEISERMRATAARQMEEMMEGLKVVIKLQRAFRARLAVRTVHRRRTEVAGFAADAFAECGQGHRQTPDEGDQAGIDTWRPGGLAAEGSPEVPAAVDVEQPGCRADRELEKIQDAGLIPFYWSAANDPIRHRVGGKHALLMLDVLQLDMEDEDWERQLPSKSVQSSPRADPERSRGGEEDSNSTSHNNSSNSNNNNHSSQSSLLHLKQPPLDLHLVGDRWALYPLGLSENFVESLDEDVWPWPRKKRKKPKVAKPPRRWVPPPPPPPQNSTNRATVRQAQLALQAARREAAALAEEDGEEEEELHPLFDNAPKAPKPRTNATLPTVPRGRRKRVPDEDGDSWATARSFNHNPRDPPATTRDPKKMGKLIDAQHFWGASGWGW